MIWGVRLSAWLLFRIIKTGTDTRFDDKRDKFFPFLGFWIFQMLWVWIVSMPITVLNAPKVQHYHQPAFGTGRDIAGVVLFAIGFIMESVSDVQKFKFRSRPGDKSTICDKGFFSWTRHPNYFGEIIMQFGKSRDLESSDLLLNNSENLILVCSHLYDCSVTSGKRLRPWASL